MNGLPAGGLEEDQILDWVKRLFPVEVDIKRETPPDVHRTTSRQHRIDRIGRGSSALLWG